MLFTRCPECETTFRVTDETLKKANGQVRCGRCASVFNAYAELHDPSAKNFEAEAQKPRASIEEAGAAPRPAPTPPAAPQAATPAPSKPLEPGPAAADVAASSLADVVAEAELAAADEAREAAAPAGVAPSNADLSATEVERVLTSNAGPPLPQSAYAWPAIAAGSERRARSRWWSVAAALALLALGAQAIHYFRSGLARNPTFGP